MNKALLENTPVKFVGSATTGTDHLDTEWMDQAGIAWATAPGSNAQAVAEYVICVVASLQTHGIFGSEKFACRVIGVGNIGKKVVDYLTVLV